ncbi:MAG TPA: protoheme IX farnesyltransferase, partial [Methylophilus sp.]|nr:protoheme IX farnesyltransferase [Methylophilus sp.]
MTQLASASMGMRSFYALCKPRVTALIVFTAIIGMLMATPGMVPLSVLLA